MSPSQNVRCTEAREALPVRPHEERAGIMVANPALAEQILQSLGEIICQGDHTPLASLAMEQDLSWAVQCEVGSVNVEGLRDSRSGARQEKQQRAIAAAARRPWIRRVN